ncbi:MAG: hypothetical protein ACT4N2_05230 [Hyphomicrobium sp.]
MKKMSKRIAQAGTVMVVAVVAASHSAAADLNACIEGGYLVSGWSAEGYCPRANNEGNSRSLNPVLDADQACGRAISSGEGGEEGRASAEQAAAVIESWMLDCVDAQ